MFSVPDLTEISKVQIQEQGVVSEIKRTLRGGNELAVGTYKGIYFVTLKDNNEFEQNTTEKYFNGKTITSFYEYELDKFAVCVCNQSEYVQIIDRNHQVELFKVTHPAGITSCLQMYPIANFDTEELPYLFIRDKLNLTLIDIKNQKGYWILKERQCDTTLYQMHHEYNEEKGTVDVWMVHWIEGNSRVLRIAFDI